VQLLVFVAATLMVIAGAVGVVARNRAVHAALSLVLTLFGVAVLFVSMEAHFLAAVQVIVYAGAIVVLILFVIMLLGVDRTEDLDVEPLPIQRPLAAIVGVAIVALLTAAIFAARDSGPLQVGVGLDVEVTESGASGAEARVTSDANIKQLSRNLFGDQVFAFELTGVLLVVAVAGTVVLTRRERRTQRSPATQAVADRSPATQAVAGRSDTAFGHAGGPGASSLVSEDA
jgi:NADH-quinone oxidoreductase subunit J